MTFPPYDATQDALEGYIDAILACSRRLMLIIDEMAVDDASRPAGTPPDEAVPERLRRLVHDAIAGEWYADEEEELRRARALLAFTGNALGR